MQWDHHDSLCQGGSSSQSTSGDCVDLTINNDMKDENNTTNEFESLRIKHATLSPMDDAGTKIISLSCSEDLKGNDCPDARSSESGNTVLTNTICSPSARKICWVVALGALATV